MRHLIIASFIISCAALAGCADIRTSPQDSTTLTAAGQTLDQSVTALTQCVTQLKSEHPELGAAIDQATAKPLETVQSAAEAYHEAVTAGQPTQSTNTLWGGVKSAMGAVIDAALPIVGHAALKSLGLIGA